MASLAATPGSALSRFVQIFFARNALVEAQGGMRLRVLSGRLWITHAGDSSDHFVSAGESYEFAPGARTFIEAAEDTRAELASPVARLRGLT
jgi:DUF2917 family protein